MQSLDCELCWKSGYLCNQYRSHFVMKKVERFWLFFHLFRSWARLAMFTGDGAEGGNGLKGRWGDSTFECGMVSFAFGTVVGVTTVDICTF